MRATGEQQQAVDLFRTGGSLKITAFAGAGKTSTLKLLADANSQRGTYLAFNKKIAVEAKDKFPSHVDCRTTHSMAWQAVKGRYSSSQKLTRAIYPKQLGEERTYRKAQFGEKLTLEPTQQAFLVLKTVSNFCQSAAEMLDVKHVPTYGALLGQPSEVLQTVKDWALAEAQTLWDLMVDPRSSVPLGHDGYLKVWALDRPIISASYILLDEAQDSNPVVLDVLRQQDAQIVYVGDRHQQIYEWRGAINAMERITTDHEAYLTKSFRFGHAVAEKASAVLKTLGEPRPIQGNENISSRVSGAGSAATILARTNATVISEVVTALDDGSQPFIVGGTDELKRLVSDVFELKKRQPAKSPEFFGFRSWAEVVTFSQMEEGQGLQSFVQLVEQHGEKKLWRAITSACEEERGADVVISTAHKAKGCEWPSVKLAADFISSRPKTDRKAAEAEVRLFYVAMTRAEEHLIVDPEVLGLFTSGAWRDPKLVAAAALKVRGHAGNGERLRSGGPTPTTRPRAGRTPSTPVRAPGQRTVVPLPTYPTYPAPAATARISGGKAETKPLGWGQRLARFFGAT